MILHIWPPSITSLVYIISQSMIFLPPKNHTSRSAPWATKTWKCLTKSLHWKGTIFWEGKDRLPTSNNHFSRAYVRFRRVWWDFEHSPKKFDCFVRLIRLMDNMSIFGWLTRFRNPEPVAVYNHQKVCQKRLYCTVVPFRGCVMQRCKSCKASFNCKSLCWLTPYGNSPYLVTA